MKALSIRAPWWWAILHGKPVENLDWGTSLRGRIYIHASKHWNREEIADDWIDIQSMAAADKLEMPFPKAEDFYEFMLAMRNAGGCLIGTVEIVDCVKDHPSAFFVGEYGFVLRNPMMLEKRIPFKGSLGFFNVPDDILVW